MLGMDFIRVGKLAFKAKAGPNLTQYDARLRAVVIRGGLLMVLATTATVAFTQAVAAKGLPVIALIALAPVAYLFTCCWMTFDFPKLARYVVVISCMILFAVVLVQSISRNLLIAAAFLLVYLLLVAAQAMAQLRAIIREEGADVA